MTEPSSPTFSRRVLASSAILGGAAALGLGVAVPVALAATTPTPKALLTQVVKDALEQKSVHVVSTLPGRETDVYDVALRDGTQTTTRPNGVDGHVRLVGKTVYVSGNRSALTQVYGLSSKQAAKLGRRWFAVKSPSRNFDILALDLNLASTLATSLPTGTLTTLPTTTMDGQAVTPVKGDIPKIDGFKGTLTLYVSNAADPLPVAATLTQGTHTATITFSKWGEKVSVKAPKGAVNPSYFIRG